MCCTSCLSHKKDNVEWFIPTTKLSNTSSLNYSELHYSEELYSFSFGSSIAPILYIDQLTDIQACDIKPALPLGLSMNSNDCSIRGTPNQILPSTNYAITVKAGNSFFTTNIFIEVKGFICSSASTTATSADPILYNGKYLICNKNQLQKITEKNGVVAAIYADIDIGDMQASLGALNNIIIEGNNHTILGEIEDEVSEDVGLFSTISDSKIQNINLKLKISGLKNVGLLSGKVKNSNIINVLIDPESELKKESNCAGLLFGAYSTDINFMQYLNVIALGKLNDKSTKISGLVACVPSSYLTSYVLDFTNSYYDSDNLGAISNNLNSLARATNILYDSNMLSLDVNYWDHNMGAYPSLKPIEPLLINF